MSGEGPGSGARRSTRNTLLALAAGVGIVACVLGLTGRAFYFADGLSRPYYLTSLNVSNGLDLLGSVFVIGGFATALAAFLHATQAWRRYLLGISACLFLGTGLVGVAVQLIRGVEYGNNHLPGKFTASAYVEGAAWLAFAVAALIAAMALLSSTVGRGHNRGLGWSGIGLTAFFVLDLVSTLLQQIAYSDFHAPSGLTSGLAVWAGGSAVAGIAAGNVAAAFLLAAGRQRSRSDWFAGREGLLTSGTLILALGFLLISIGGMVYAGAGLGEDGKFTAAAWLDAINWLGLAAAAACASAGFASSRRAAVPERSDPPADPDIVDRFSIGEEP